MHFTNYRMPSSGRPACPGGARVPSEYQLPDPLGVESRKDNFVCAIPLEALRSPMPARHLALTIQHEARVVGDGIYEEPVKLLIRHPQRQAPAAMGYLSDRGMPFSASAVHATVDGDRLSEASE